MWQLTPATQLQSCSGWRNKNRQRREEQQKSSGWKERNEEREWRIIYFSLAGCLHLGLILPGSEIKSEITQLSNIVFYFCLVSEQRNSTSPSTHIHTKWLRHFLSKDITICLTYSMLMDKTYCILVYCEDIQVPRVNVLLFLLELIK